MKLSKQAQLAEILKNESRYAWPTPVIDVSALPATLPRSLAETVWADDALEVMIVDWVGGRLDFHTVRTAYL